MGVTNLEAAMQQALELHRAGDLRSAALAYERILQTHPTEADAWHMLGVLSHQLGKHELAIKCLASAIKLNPIEAAYHSNLGVVYRSLGRLPEAIAEYRLAILRKPDYPEAYSNLGQAFREHGELDEAERQLREALRLRPDYLDALYNLAQVQQDRGARDDAIATYREVVRQDPNHVAAWNNLGVALKNQGKFDEAREVLEQAIQINPELVEAYYNLAQTFHAQGLLVEALDCYSQFLTVRPGYAAGHCNMGNALEDLGQVDEAIDCYREALRLRPEMVEGHNNLAHSLQVQGVLEDAEKGFRRALSLAPDNLTVLSNLLFFLNYQPKYDQERLLAEHQQWETLHGAKIPRRSHSNRKDPDRPLRIGYISPDFRSHPVAQFIEPVLAYHDASQFQTYLYADVAVPDLVSQQLQELSHAWVNTRWLDHDQVADRVQADEIDILVDLAGHTALGRLPVFARKPAPVQVTYLGYPNTTGLSAIDYRLTDAIADPPEEPNLHSETLVRLEPSFSCYAPRIDAPEVNDSPVARNGFVTFGSLHALSKLNTRVLDAWAKLLKAVPNSRLLIARHEFNGSTRDRFVAEFRKRGIERSRLIVDREVQPGQAHLPLYGEIDISLDVFPWSGHTTACEAIWMGVPVITLYGNRHAGRMVASMLRSLGHPEWIADTANTYVHKARDLAQDIDLLVKLRATLREQMRQSGICDGARFIRSLESAYRQMWRTWCER